MKPAHIWITAVVAPMALLCLGSWMNGPDDIQAAQDQHLTGKDLRESEAGSERRQVIAQKLCNQERGPNSEARWLADGSLVCTVRNGYRKAAL